MSFFSFEHEKSERFDKFVCLSHVMETCQRFPSRRPLRYACVCPSVAPGNNIMNTGAKKRCHLQPRENERTRE